MRSEKPLETSYVGNCSAVGARFNPPSRSILCCILTASVGQDGVIYVVLDSINILLKNKMETITQQHGCVPPTVLKKSPISSIR